MTATYHSPFYWWQFCIMNMLYFLNHFLQASKSYGPQFQHLQASKHFVGVWTRLFFFWELHLHPLQIYLKFPKWNNADKITNVWNRRLKWKLRCTYDTWAILLDSMESIPLFQPLIYTSFSWKREKWKVFSRGQK